MTTATPPDVAGPPAHGPRRPPLRLIRTAASSIQLLGEGRALTNDEVVARLDAILRGQADVTPLVYRKLRLGDLDLDLTSREVSRGGELITLTGTEFDLLRFLMRHPGHALSREEILDGVWRCDYGGRCGVVDLYIHFLRKKIDTGRPSMIQAVGEFGYLLAPARI
ncbi:MAG: winged helix-turn-helix domain-containing protein [Mycobacterium sp.]